MTAVKRTGRVGGDIFFQNFEAFAGIGMAIGVAFFDDRIDDVGHRVLSKPEIDEARPGDLNVVDKVKAL